MYNKTIIEFGFCMISLIIKDGWILAEFFFCVFMDRDEVEVNKHAKNERGQYQVILTEQAWSIKDLLYGFRGIFLAGHGG